MQVPDQKMFHELMRDAVSNGGFTIMMNPNGGWDRVHHSTIPTDTSSCTPLYQGLPCERPRYLVEMIGREGIVPTTKQALKDIDYVDFMANFKWAAKQLPSGYQAGTTPYKYMLFYGCSVDANGVAEFDFSCAYSELNAALAHARRNKTTRYVWDQVLNKAITLDDSADHAGPVMFPCR